MQNSTDLSERFLDFAVDIIKITAKLKSTDVGRHIGNQLMRSTTSSGANYEEACGAESKADFIHKMQIVLKELRESLFWLKLLKRVNLTDDKEVQTLMVETDELTRIIAKSVITAKSRR